MAEYMNNEHGFDWDGEISNDSSFVLLAEGEYGFAVESVTRARYPGGAKLPACNKVELKLRVEGPYGSNVISHNLFLHSRCEGLLCEFFTALGLRRHGETLRMRWDIVGMTGRCKVGVRTYTDRDGNERQTNEVKQFLDPANRPEQTAMELPKTGAWTSGRF